MKSSRKRLPRAFSLIELVIVIIIMGVISAIAIPRMMRGTDNADVTGLQSDLAVLRSAMEMCRYEHGAYPADADAFVAQLTTVVSGYGPYIIKVPPLKTGVKKGEAGVMVIVTDPPAAADGGDFGWLYNATTGGIWANDIEHLDK